MLWVVEMYLDGIVSAERISHLIGVCRGTVYNWVNRYREGGKEGLRYRSRRPHNIRHMPADIVEKMVYVYNRDMAVKELGMNLEWVI